MDDVLLYEGRCSSKSHRCEWKNGPDDLVYIIALFLCRLILVDMLETACLQTVEVYYCGGYVPLSVTVSRIEYLCTIMDKHSCVLSIDIVPIVMEIIQLDNNDDARDATS